ncbi:MAG: MFS transporter [Ruminococcaceae bacterium]|nr:MFS transporter [Oscillospiraceae bacterium]
MEGTKKLSYYKVVALGFLVYFFSYAMRLDYSASLVSIISDLNITKTAASAAVTGSLITYGVGQVICGIIGDKISPVKMISVAMLGTVLVNILVSFCTRIELITVLWCINGVCQAMLWPPLCRFVSEQVGTEKYSNAVTIVGLSASIGTIFIYLFVPAVLEITIWRNVFRCMSFFGIIMILVWLFATRGIKMGKAAVQKKKEEKKISLFGMIALAGLIPIFIIIILQGILRDGIQTWLPSLVKEEFKFEESTSILSTAVLPVLSMVSVIISNTIYNKLKNELKTATIMFSVAALATFPMALEIKTPPLVSILLASLISGCMHGVNHMLISLIPKHFSRYGMVSTFSGILNSFTYVGASVASFGYAFISDNFGWAAVQISWCVTAVVASIICLLKIKGWTSFMKENR